MIAPDTHHHMIFGTPLMSSILISAGIVPNLNIFNQDLSTLYFLLIIPPAAYHLYVLIRDHFWPKK